MKKSVFVILMFLAGICQSGNAQEAFLGEIRMFAGTYAPVGWEFCGGQTLAIQQNNALFALLGTTYGGNGTTTFNLPDLRGRVPVGSIMYGSGSGLSNYQLGEKGGTEQVTLIQQGQVPISTSTSPNSYAASAQAQVNTVQPYLGMNYIICTTNGLWPQRP